MSMRDEQNQRAERAGQRNPEREDAQHEGPRAGDAATDLTPAQPGSRRRRREARGDVASQRISPLPFILVGALVVLLAAVLIWWFALREVPEEPVSEERDDNPGIDGIIQRNADPDEWLAGDCLTGFESEHAPATIIACEHDYDRQVIHWGELEDDSYPGEEEVAQQAVSLCEDSGELDQDEVDSVDYELEVEVSHPSQDTWAGQSDRRVNCLLRRVDGAVLSGNFVIDPQEGSSAESSEEDSEEGEAAGGETGAEGEVDSPDGEEETEGQEGTAQDAEADSVGDREGQDGGE